MEANRGQNGIQLLLAAEQEAQHVLATARDGILPNTYCSYGALNFEFTL